MRASRRVPSFQFSKTVCTCRNARIIFSTNGIVFLPLNVIYMKNRLQPKTCRNFLSVDAHVVVVAIHLFITAVVRPTDKKKLVCVVVVVVLDPVLIIAALEAHYLV